MDFKIVLYIYQFEFHGFKDLQQMAVMTDSTIMYKPRMIKLKYKDCTILVFNSLRARIIGKEKIDADFLRDFTLKYMCKVKNFRIQCMTVVYNHKPLNLSLLDNNSNLQNNMELFPAVTCKYNKFHFNIFSSGKIVITGLKCLTDITIAISYINKQLRLCQNES